MWKWCFYAFYLRLEKRLNNRLAFCRYKLTSITLQMSKHRGGITLPSTTSASKHSSLHPCSLLMPCFLPQFLLLSLYQSQYMISSPSLMCSLLAFPYATLVKTFSNSFLLDAIENRPSQKLLLCNRTQCWFNLHSQEYYISTTVIVFQVLKKKSVFLLIFERTNAIFRSLSFLMLYSSS